MVVNRTDEELAKGALPTNNPSEGATFLATLIGRGIDAETVQAMLNVGGYELVEFAVIADLRAARERIKELEEWVDKMETFLGGYREY